MLFLYFCHSTNTNENEVYPYYLPFAGAISQQFKCNGIGTDRNRIFLHTVTKGQSLYSIASMYHVSVDDIVRLNPGSKEQIRAGQALKIPQAQYSNEDGKQFHTIQAGETLYQLTLKYHVTAQAICKANPGLSAENFRIGQVIVIPAQDNAPAQTEQTAQAEPAVKKNEWRDMHKVARKETIFSISQQYGITQEELIAANPELKNGKLKKEASFSFLTLNHRKQERQHRLHRQLPATKNSSKKILSAKSR